MKYTPINELFGRNIVSVVNNNDEELIFTDDRDYKYIFYHESDCCESVLIEDICGDLEDLIGILTEVEFTTTDTLEDFKDPQYAESQTWTFYRFSTSKGTVVVRWYGESNGYYSESVDLKIVKPDGNWDRVWF